MIKNQKLQTEYDQKYAYFDHLMYGQMGHLTALILFFSTKIIQQWFLPLDAAWKGKIAILLVECWTSGKTIHSQATEHNQAGWKKK